MSNLEWRIAEPHEHGTLRTYFQRTRLEVGKLPDAVHLLCDQTGDIVFIALQYLEPGKWERWGLRKPHDSDIQESWSSILGYLRPLIGDRPFLEMYPPDEEIINTAPFRWFWVVAPYNSLRECDMRLITNLEVVSEYADGAYISGGGGMTTEGAKEIAAGKLLSWEIHVPRDPLQRWTYNVNGVYCPNCMDENIRNEVGPLSERNGELPEICGRCGAECKHPEKGDRGAECNRTVCKNEKANWFNHSTRAWYCRNCAAKLNHANHDEAQRLYGHALCTFGSGGARE